VIEVTGRVGTRSQAARVPTCQIIGALDLKTTPTARTNDDVVPGLKAGFAQYVHGDRDLMLAGDSAHCFTSIALS
jgi:hypothetical protein